MDRFRLWFDRTDRSITSFLAKYSIPILRISLGITFFWFGFLKFFPGASPAQELAGKTMELLSFGLVGRNAAVLILAAWESLIGLGLIFGLYLRATLFLLIAQMLGTLTPMVLFPSETFTVFPFSPTLEGQYIIKNLVLIGAGLVVGSTVRGGRIVAEKPPPESETQH